MPTIKLTLEYDGTAYAGWQRQPNLPTVQSEVERVLARITQRRLTTVASGRTDAGVHALGQVVSFRTDAILSPQEWARALNGLLPQDVVVHRVEFVENDFHARFGAVAKTYEYRILNGPTRSPLGRDRVWHVPKALDITAMQRAADHLMGTHDFSSFQGSRSNCDNPICMMQPIGWFWEPPQLHMRFTADRFLKQMVRNIVGTLVDIGLGRRATDEMNAILAARDRRVAGPTAPPYGLYLLKVLYHHDP